MIIKTKLKKLSILSLLLCFIFVGCSLVTKDVNNHTILKKSFWKDTLSLPLEKRVNEGNSELVKDYIQSWKKETGIIYKTPSTEKRVTTSSVKKSLLLLPKVLYSYLDRNIVQIIISPNLEVPIVVSPLKDSQGFIILIDSKINSLGLNDWYLWREKSAFNVLNKNIQIEAFLSYNNNEIDTLHFILAQAMAIMISHDQTIFPKDLQNSSLSKTLFIKHSWINIKGVITSKYERILDEMKFISFYGRSAKSFSDEKIYEFYRRLEKTNFTNLYSSAGPRRDFIESLATYIHVYYFQRPFTIDFYERERLLDTFTHCLNLPRCLGKSRDIKTILDRKL